jgi:hypothetical protein
MIPSNINYRGGCKRCSTLAQYRHYARRDGLPLCENGHGLVLGNVTREGSGCAECTFGPEAFIASAAPPPPPDTWLDWVAVWQALSGRVPARPLTKYELLVALRTLIERNCWTRAQAADWLRENAAVEVPNDNGEHLEHIWAKRRNSLPALTLSQAIAYRNEPDYGLQVWAGDYEEHEDDEAAEAA